jgi:hypothetical protein
MVAAFAAGVIILAGIVALLMNDARETTLKQETYFF